MNSLLCRVGRVSFFAWLLVASGEVEFQATVQDWAETTAPMYAAFEEAAKAEMWAQYCGDTRAETAEELASLWGRYDECREEVRKAGWEVA